jgi:hypothetical protein
MHGAGFALVGPPCSIVRRTRGRSRRAGNLEARGRAEREPGGGAAHQATEGQLVQKLTELPRTGGSPDVPARG